MELNRQRAKVVMLPTDDNSCMCFSEGKLYYYPKDTWFTKDDETQPQHLYFTTDEEIKEDDWMWREGERPTLVIPHFHWDFGVKYKKVISSNDPKLGLPSPTQAFIEKYCKLGGIDEVDVECEFAAGYQTKENPDLMWRLKVDSHNTITTREIKNSWSREEVESLCRSMAYSASSIVENYGHSGHQTFNKKAFEDWIKEKL